MGNTVLYDDGRHRNVLLDDFGLGGLAVQANQHVIVDGGDGGAGLVLDPGGHKVFAQALAEAFSVLGHAKLQKIFLSHQDPDIVAALNGWLMTSDADAYVSALWIRFVPHFLFDHLVLERLKPIPDEGMVLPLGDNPLVLVPAHFLHSEGCHQLYDPVSKILYTGDLGAAIGADYVEVPDFDAHLPYMEGFHRRYMASARVMTAWAQMVRGLDIDIIAPQHGPYFKGKDMVRRFIDWCDGFECGVDLITSLYVLPRGVAVMSGDRQHRTLGEDAPRWLVAATAIVGTTVVSAGAWAYSSGSGTGGAGAAAASSVATAPRSPAVEGVTVVPTTLVRAATTFVPRTITSSSAPATAASTTAAPPPTTAAPPPTTAAAAVAAPTTAPVAPPTAPAPAPAPTGTAAGCPETVTIHFDFGLWQPLVSADDPQLAALAAWAAAHPDTHVVVTGHASSIGGEVDNLLLSYKRATSTATLLRSLGIGDGQLTLRAAGELDPVAGQPPESAVNQRTVVAAESAACPAVGS